MEHCIEVNGCGEVISFCYTKSVRTEKIEEIVERFKEVPSNEEYIHLAVTDCKGSFVNENSMPKVSKNLGFYKFNPKDFREIIEILKKDQSIH